MTPNNQHEPNSLPLSGLRVIELGQVLSGPFAGAILSDLGAEVLKIEKCLGGDDARHMGPAFQNGDALNFHLFNRGKKSIALDLKSQKGLDALHTLLNDADILIHNLRPGVTQNLGIDGKTLCAQYPKLIYCDISAFGHEGPMHLRPGYEPLIQAFSGLSSTNGGPNDPPIRIGASVCDQGTGMWAVIGVLSMLEKRRHTHRGGMVQTSLLETALVWNGQKSEAFINQKQLPIRHASGHPNFVPYEAFDALDGPLLICCGNDRLFAKLSTVLDQGHWIHDPKFSTNRQRLIHKSELLEQLCPLLLKKSREHWVQVFEEVGVPCSPIFTLPQALENPQVQALELRLPVPDQDFKLTGLPLSFDGLRPPIKKGAPKLGEHNADFNL
jgi:crotonobetainyl-CoA:carnitine CoA-transferase CaiB-like acyl-CoA transferase